MVSEPKPRSERYLVTGDSLESARLVAAVAGPACGAVATFIGLVREQNAGRRVLWLDYEAYAPLAVRSFELIGRDRDAYRLGGAAHAELDEQLRAICLDGADAEAKIEGDQLVGPALHHAF